MVKHSKDLLVLLLGILLMVGGVVGTGQKEAQYTDEGLQLVGLLGYSGKVEDFHNYAQQIRDDGAEYLSRHFKTSNIVDAGQRSHEVKDGAKYFNTSLVKRYGYVVSVNGPYVKRVRLMDVRLLVAGSVIIGFQVGVLLDTYKKRQLKDSKIKGLPDDFYGNSNFKCPFGCCDAVKGKVKEHKLK